MILFVCVEVFLIKKAAFTHVIWAGFGGLPIKQLALTLSILGLDMLKLSPDLFRELLTFTFDLEYLDVDAN